MNTATDPYQLPYQLRALELEDWTEVRDPIERRKIQNRNASRTYRN